MADTDARVSGYPNSKDPRHPPPHRPPRFAISLCSTSNNTSVVTVPYCTAAIQRDVALHKVTRRRHTGGAVARQSYAMAVINFSKAFMGASSFELPWAFAQAGLVGGVVGTLAFAVLSNVCFSMLVQVSHLCSTPEHKNPTYPQIGRMCFGVAGETSCGRYGGHDHRVCGSYRILSGKPWLHWLISFSLAMARRRRTRPIQQRQCSPRSLRRPSPPFARHERSRTPLPSAFSPPLWHVLSSRMMLSRAQTQRLTLGACLRASQPSGGQRTPYSWEMLAISSSYRRRCCLSSSPWTRSIVPIFHRRSASRKSSRACPTSASRS